MKLIYVLTNVDSQEQLEIKIMSPLDAARANEIEREKDTRDRWLVEE